MLTRDAPLLSFELHVHLNATFSTAILTFAEALGYATFVVEEVCSFDQEDLLEDDVYLVDVGTTVYAWIGGGANADERRLAIDTAQKYNAAGEEQSARVESLRN